MSAFKVGDKVICTNVDGDTTAPGVGHINTVISIEDGSWPIYAIDHDDDGIDVAYSESEIKLYDPNDYKHNDNYIKRCVLESIEALLEDNNVYVTKTEQIGDDLFFTLNNGQTVQISVKVFYNG